MAFLYAFLLITVPLVVSQKPAENNQPWFLNSDDTTCCQCVPYFDCKDGQLIKLGKPNSKRNVQKCDSAVEFCCLVPKAPTSCSSFPPGPMPKVNTDPQPKKTCECVPWDTCTPEKVVTDGNGAHSDLGLTTHSKCSKQLDVCCQQSHDHGTAGPQVGVRAGQPREGDCVCVTQEQCVDGVLNTDGTGIIQPRFRADINCPNNGDVCCDSQRIGSGNMRNENYLILTGFVTFVSVAKGNLM